MDFQQNMVVFDDLNNAANSHDNYYLEKQKVMRRRSSLGRNLKCQGNIQISVTNDNDKDDITKNLKLHKIPVSVKAYNDKTTLLEKENAIWKHLMHSRLSLKTQAKREYQEAVNGETVIEEDEVLQTLSKELSTILATKPNYSRYLQDVKRAGEVYKLTMFEIENAVQRYAALKHAAHLQSKSCHIAIERELARPSDDLDTKHLLLNISQEN